ncbi:MAG: hypothetical protein H7248_09115 [Microbacteriaceae bacterium]|nr:hypothetical protein [Microbacteriaceae bacterium]
MPAENFAGGYPGVGGGAPYLGAKQGAKQGAQQGSQQRAVAGFSNTVKS